MDIPFQSSGTGGSTSNSHHRPYPNSQFNPQFHIPSAFLQQQQQQQRAGRLGYGSPNTLFGSGAPPVFGSNSSNSSPLKNSGGTHQYNFSNRYNRTPATTKNSPSSSSNSSAGPYSNTRVPRTRSSYNHGAGGGTTFQNMNSPSTFQSHGSHKSSPPQPQQLQTPSSVPNQQQQQHYQNNGNGVSTPSNNSNNSNSGSISNSSTAPPPVSPTTVQMVTTALNSTSIEPNKADEYQPQYRIFKRGDSIPGISCPTTVPSTPNVEGQASEAIERDETREATINGMWCMRLKLCNFVATCMQSV